MEKKTWNWNPVDCSDYLVACPAHKQDWQHKYRFYWSDLFLGCRPYMHQQMYIEEEEKPDILCLSAKIFFFKSLLYFYFPHCPKLFWKLSYDLLIFEKILLLTWIIRGGMGHFIMQSCVEMRCKSSIFPRAVNLFTLTDTRSHRNPHQSRNPTAISESDFY